ncbi:hypothetical protein C8R45DRAFT_934342 [Mycena sanguinolenta]|nr:hypothetical protein C8R45DRAFT_934342 [Mycena sanguinolenta]
MQEAMKEKLMRRTPGRIGLHLQRLGKISSDDACLFNLVMDASESLSQSKTKPVPARMRLALYNLLPKLRKSDCDQDGLRKRRVRWVDTINVSNFLRGVNMIACLSAYPAMLIPIDRILNPTPFPHALDTNAKWAEPSIHILHATAEAEATVGFPAAAHAGKRENPAAPVPFDPPGAYVAATTALRNDVQSDMPVKSQRIGKHAERGRKYRERKKAEIKMLEGENLAYRTKYHALQEDYRKVLLILEATLIREGEYRRALFELEARGKESQVDHCAQCNKTHAGRINADDCIGVLSPAAWNFQHRDTRNPDTSKTKNSFSDFAFEPETLCITCRSMNEVESHEMKTSKKNCCRINVFAIGYGKVYWSERHRFNGVFELEIMFRPAS